MGADARYPEEHPARLVDLEPFALDIHPVTNAQFGRFAVSTGYVTNAERVRPAGSAVYSRPDGPVDLADPANWWEFAPGACWHRPFGWGSDLAGLSDHPVVHITMADAQAYCRWAVLRLPTEAEWERAAAIEPVPQSWPLAADGRLLANVWIGEFPHAPRRPDPPGTMPVGAFAPRSLGIYDQLGQVWELTADGVAKGGSYLCSESYCTRYRPAARMTPDGPTGHVGFRCATTGAEPTEPKFRSREVVPARAGHNLTRTPDG